MVERRNRCLVIDCIVASVQFETPETARDPGYPAVLALECPETSIEAAMITLHRIMDAGGSLHLLRNTDENTVILLAGVEVWVLKPPSR